MFRCRKKKYTSRLEADIALSKIQSAKNEHKRPKTETRSYPCNFCKGDVWHLTSRKNG